MSATNTPNAAAIHFHGDGRDEDGVGRRITGAASAFCNSLPKTIASGGRWFRSFASARMHTDSSAEEISKDLGKSGGGSWRCFEINPARLLARNGGLPVNIS